MKCSWNIYLARIDQVGVYFCISRMILVQIWHSRGVGPTWKQTRWWRLNCSAPIRRRARHQSECVGATTHSPAMLSALRSRFDLQLYQRHKTRERDQFFMSIDTHTHICCSRPLVNVDFSGFFSRQTRQIMPRKAQGRTTFDWNFCWGEAVGFGMCLRWTKNSDAITRHETLGARVKVIENLHCKAINQSPGEWMRWLIIIAIEKSEFNAGDGPFFILLRDWLFDNHHGTLTSQSIS